MIEEFLEKAKENLRSAELCFENGLYNASANRACYAAFQSAVSALADRGITREKIEHKWVQAEFNGRLIGKQKVYPGGMKSYLMKMQTIRDQADYSHQNVNKKTARRQIVRADEIVASVEKVLKKW